jgi:hypothetical protein
MATLIAICSWDSQSSNTAKPRQQRFFLNPNNNLTQRDYNQDNRGWQEVGNIIQPYSSNRTCFLGKEIPKDIADDIRNNEVTHGTIWRL